MQFPAGIFLASSALGSVFVGLASAAFLIGGLANATGHPKIRADFVLLGFPGWWCWVTAALEIATALLLPLPGTRTVGVVLGTCVMLAAIAAIVRIGAYRKLAPPFLFLSLLALAGLS